MEANPFGETVAKLQTTASFSRFELGHLQKQTPVTLTFNELYFEIYQGLWSASHTEAVLQRSLGGEDKKNEAVLN